MSVDYYSCECCGEALYEEAVTCCEGCGNHICCDCICNINELPKAKYYFPEGSKNNNGELKKIYCPICCQKAIEDANPHKDFLGKALNIGDEVVFANISRTTRWLEKGEITGFRGDLFAKVSHPYRYIPKTTTTTEVMKKFIIKI